MPISDAELAFRRRVLNLGLLRWWPDRTHVRWVGRVLLVLAWGGVAGASGSRASEITTYSYDALGRLNATSISGGPNSGTATATCFDSAGNRATQVVVLSGAATCTQANVTVSSIADEEVAARSSSDGGNSSLDSDLPGDEGSDGNTAVDASDEGDGKGS